MLNEIEIVIPVYNEHLSIQELTQRISKNTNLLKKYRFSITFIDDGSIDGTTDVILKQIKRYSNIKIRLYKLIQNSGKTAALSLAFEKTKALYVITIDGDLQDDPIYIRKFINQIENGEHDLIVGNRINKYKNNIIKKISSKSVNILMRKATKYNIHDMNCGYKILTGELANNINLKSDYHRFIPLLAAMSGYSVGEVDILQKKRLYGESKYGKTGLIRFSKTLFDMLVLIFLFKFKDSPFKLFGKLGIFNLFIGSFILLYLTIRWFWGYYIFGRPLFFLGILLIIVGTNILSLGLLGELISSQTHTRRRAKIAQYYESPKDN